MTGDPLERDAQRAKVYAAEQLVRTLFDRAAQSGIRTVEFFGTELTLPPEARFGSLAAVQAYVDRVLELPQVRDTWPQATRVTVRARRGTRAAHYENSGGLPVIAIPDQGRTAWALRELVVLHEIAHHLSATRPPHGPEFTATLCAVAESVMGPELGYVLRVVFAKEGVR